MGEVIYASFASKCADPDRSRSAKKRTLLNAEWLWEFKGWTYKLPHANLPRRWEKEIAGVVVWAYILELKGRYGRYTFERRSDAFADRWKGRR
jgi:hypothetical protein